MSQIQMILRDYTEFFFTCSIKSTRYMNLLPQKRDIYMNSHQWLELC